MCTKFKFSHSKRATDTTRQTTALTGIMSSYGHWNYFDATQFFNTDHLSSLTTMWVL